ncbi:hypothetical protein F511_05224 [Dorcoceras hygrometricum]|uniref:HhH-GPD domain-containing protein n=1 Tax=Dorcoceras hygrometricum TaxID=472368 RepID=A0A2Z7CK92_9LAMI|nr:hypothetical protein F511_05224 [Dorcoceras hygrometricum]
MAEGLKGAGEWVPVTPMKTVQECSAGKERDSCDRILGNLCPGDDAWSANISVDSGSNAYSGFNGDISDKVENEETWKVEVPSERIRGFQLNEEQTHHDFETNSTTSKTSYTPSHPNPKKLGSCEVGVDKKKRPKMKKHRPKIFDETKPKKTPKSQMANPLTPKQKTPRRSIPRTSPPEKNTCTRKENPPEGFDGNLECATKSCRQKLVFKLVNHARDQLGHDSCGVIDGVTDAKVMETSLAKDEHVQMVDGFQLSANSSTPQGEAVDDTSYCAVKGFTDLLNACTDSLLRDSLEDTQKLYFNFNLEEQNFDSCPGIGTIIQQYQRRKKTRSNPLYEEDMNFQEKIHTPEEGSKLQCGTNVFGLKVYKRLFRPNECLKNSRKLGPNFPRIFKKKRMKQQRATKFPVKMDPCIRHKVTSKKRSKYHRAAKKIKKRCPSGKLADGTQQKMIMDNELPSNFAIQEYNLRLIQPSQKQIRDAMDYPKSFNCVWSLCPCPMAYFRKKRSRTHSRKIKFSGVHEEMKHSEPRGCSSLLNWSVHCKRKRSNLSAQSRDLSSLYLVPAAVPLKALSVVTQDSGQENVEDCSMISVKHIPYLDEHCLVDTPISVVQHLDLKHMFSNLNADEVQGMTDFISQKFERLCIADVNNQLVVRDQKVSDAILPYKGKFDPSKRQKLLPKVDLDAETLRVWNLLMETDGSEDIGEADKDSKIDWDSVREIFRGRIDSFISCMHRIQGDRRFSPWKGSVVDSVIGVFLTQNVSDHLSSSAFMSLAAKFPPSLTKHSSSNKNNVSHQESADSKEIGCDQSTDRSNEKPCLCSTELDMRQICICAINKTLSEDERSYKNAVHVIQDSSSCKSSTTFSQVSTSENSAGFRKVLLGEENESCQQLNNQEENILLCDQSIVDLKFGDGFADSISCKSSDTISIPCTSEISATLKEQVLKVEEKALLQCVHGYRENKMSSGQGMDDTKFDGAVSKIPNFSSHKSSTTISRFCHGENATQLREESALLRQIFNHEENISSCAGSITDVKYGDTAPGVPDSSGHKSSTPISRPCSVENSSIFRQDLLFEENTFLQQYYGCESDTTLCDKNAGGFNFGASRSDPGADNTTNLDDLGNININGLPNVGKDRESAGGRNKRQVKEKQESHVNWDNLRKQYSCGKSKDTMNNNIDSANWDAVRQASVQEVAKVIMDRGMNNILAGRIKDFLDRMIEDHGTIDLEWLRDVPPDKAKSYLLSIPGLGLKSTECVRLLTLRHHAFPVDTNVGRILVRLGWVPLLPLPEDVQIHLLNNYPLVDTIQKYIWPRLCKISNETLYECHYQMITFGKVFCTKRQPNCNVCPMRGQCRHFASAYASARLRLPGVKGGTNEHEAQVKSSQNAMDTNLSLLVHCDDDVSRVENICFNSEPIVEFPPSPEPASREMAERDIEDLGYESDEEIPTIKLSQEEFTKNLLDFMEKTNFLNGEGTMSKELVALSPAAATIPMPKLKFVGRLRTVHQVYEVPDSHPLLAGFENREPDDPCPYLLAIWTNEETAKSSQPPKGACSCQESTTCDVGTCCLRDEVQKQEEELIQGTILVFADHESSRQPIPVPRKWIWNLRRRSLYCGTSTTSIFRGMTTDEIQYCFWRGFICVRATDRVTRAPRPLARRFHICKSRAVGKE